MNAPSELRTLVVPRRANAVPDAELRAKIGADEMPDGISAHAAVGATFVNEHYFAQVPGRWGRMLRRLPFLAAQMLEVLRRGRDYDAVLTWTEPPAIVLAALGFLWRQRPAHITIWMWPSKPKKALPLRLLHRGIDRVLMWSPVQRRFAQESIGIPEEKFVDVRYPVDLRFWRPTEREGDLICSAGQEMRDYGTLVEALQGLDVRCHIAAGTSDYGTPQDRWWKATVGDRPIPENVSIGPKSYAELRELYARSRFVVVPLLPSDADNGITSITEAFAMGKAIICTETTGQVGVLEAGVNCLRVPTGDPAALRAAIQQLWSDAETCERLGGSGRKLVEAGHGLDQYTQGMVRAVSEAVAERARAGRSRRVPRAAARGNGP
jgi:glycosyltransferase involved in cell wall biosynthesis